MAGLVAHRTNRWAIAICLAPAARRAVRVQLREASKTICEPCVSCNSAISTAAVALRQKVVRCHSARNPPLAKRLVTTLDAVVIQASAHLHPAEHREVLLQELVHRPVVDAQAEMQVPAAVTAVVATTRRTSSNGCVTHSRNA